jgi:hypothetical protein
MNAAYAWYNGTGNFSIPNPAVTQLNSYMGGVYQQATSGVTTTSKSKTSCNCSHVNQLSDQNCYTQDTGCFATYGYEYKPGISHCCRFA